MKTVEDLVLTYYSSNDFSMLRERSQKDYKYFLGILVGEFGDADFNEIGRAHVRTPVTRGSRMPSSA